MTATQLSGKTWRRLFRDVYVEANAEVDHLNRGAAALRYLVPEGILTGVSAAFAYGVLFGAADLVEMLVPVPHGPIKGIIMHHGPTMDGDVREVAGLPVASPARTCWDLVRHRPLPEVIAYLDQFLGRGLVTLEELEKYAWEREREPYWQRFLQAARLADGGAESPGESRSRLMLVTNGVPHPTTQFVITHRGRFVARVDLAWAEYRVALEYDGFEFHSARSDLARDRARLNRQVLAGWLIIHVTGDRLRRDLPSVVAEVLAALRTRGWPERPRLTDE
ncbi:hypothetical protein AB0M47_41610 [Hamadaea sp. NPDC051192]|uniref:hypothetical protein n=1 Tax=Hamadaea sp. NPDC051192 TaxID=3154940 RepID=UPI0034200ECB